MLYFAYGSNMSLARLRARVPSALALGQYRLHQHDLRFHKACHDGSAKCDAYFTSNVRDVIYGALFNIDPDEKPVLDKAEGLGFGYDEKTVDVLAVDGRPVRAVTYVATHIDTTLKPYSWYMNHVLIGAQETALPLEYIETKMISIAVVEDADSRRDARQRAIHD
ncbi:gamma-glutamylcyclotransferase [Marinobacter salinisoli]|uniref:Gamma-glutamylcyclotransferase n=1 Tax=Marinobacter salinisoli TaxID=2769486 RepID=A0ABX7MQR8_9GAMM|nr:gamma-glutamylcyclotransferase family protein [Marinobacter salinisoli]QSP94680.1 gamma-glutamylcyclotransferase [Marinobacter salinisoli]